MPPMPPPKSALPPQLVNRLPAILIVLVGIVAYCNSLQGPFLFDDELSIMLNPDFGGPSKTFEPPNYLPLPKARITSTTLTSRPVLWLSFWIDYQLAGKQPWLYHLTNLLIHLINALLVYAIIRRTLQRRECWGDRFTDAAPWLAATVAAIWVAHPLNTVAVTYIIQRAESLAALFYLMVIYCLIRSADRRPTSWAWSCGAVAACFLGVGTKEIVATAPLVALIYDRTFLAGSFARSLRLRKWLYAALACTWIPAAFLIATGHGRGNTVGFNHGISSLVYARTELDVIAHYLRLVFWPSGLVLSGTDWPFARHWSDFGGPALFVVLLLILSLIALWSRPWLGFLGVWVFIILAPTSSIVPVFTEPEAEQRMYLPLAAIICLIVIPLWLAATRLAIRRQAVATAAAVVIALATVTILRNNVYHSSLRIWADNVAKRPNNARALLGYGHSLSHADWAAPPGSAEQKQFAAQAAVILRRAINLTPPDDASFLPTLQTLGHMLVDSGQTDEAERYYKFLIQHCPPLREESYLMLGSLFAATGDLKTAKSDFEAAIAAQPDQPDGHYFLAITLQSLNDSSGAQAEFRKVMRIDPGYRDTALRISDSPATSRSSP
jgi:tetratricopeptide (TPR) repeat protein